MDLVEFVEQLLGMFVIGVPLLHLIETIQRDVQGPGLAFDLVGEIKAVVFGEGDQASGQDGTDFVKLA